MFELELSFCYAISNFFSLFGERVFEKKQESTCVWKNHLNSHSFFFIFCLFICVGNATNRFISKVQQFTRRYWNGLLFCVFFFFCFQWEQKNVRQNRGVRESVSFFVCLFVRLEMFGVRSYVMLLGWWCRWVIEPNKMFGRS